MQCNEKIAESLDFVADSMGKILEGRKGDIRTWNRQEETRG